MVDITNHTASSGKLPDIIGFTSVKDLLTSIDDMVIPGGPVTASIGFGHSRQFWWPENGVIQVYVTGLSGWKYNPLMAVRRYRVLAAIREHLDTMSAGFVKVPVSEILIAPVAFEPASGGEVACDEITIILDEARINQTRPLDDPMRTFDSK